MSFLGEKTGADAIYERDAMMRMMLNDEQYNAYNKNVTEKAVSRLPTQGQKLLGGIVQQGAAVAGQIMQENKQADIARELTRIRSGLPTESSGQISQRFSQAKQLQGSMSPQGYANDQLGYLRRLRERVNNIRGL